MTSLNGPQNDEMSTKADPLLKCQKEGLQAANVGGRAHREEGVLVQLKGEVRADGVVCQKCGKHEGVFRSCRSVPGIHRGACACSIYQWKMLGRALTTAAYEAEFNEAKKKKALKNQARKVKATNASTKKRRECPIVTLRNQGHSQERRSLGRKVPRTEGPQNHPQTIYTDMAASNLLIPERTSAKYALQERKLYLKENRTTLKRKLDSISAESSPIEYQKCKIQDIQTEIEEHELHRSWLDFEYAEKKLTDNGYLKDQRNTNTRVISLRDELWKYRQNLRDEEEKAGKTPPLGPDSEGAFVYTLLALYKDPNTSSKRSSSEQSNMRKAAIERYESAKDARPGKLWCPISQDYFDAEWMRAAHIVPRRLGSGVVDYIFGSGNGSRLNTTDNCLIIHVNVERSFDNGSFVLVPADPKESPIKRWKIQMTKLSAKHKDLGKKTLAERDGDELVFKNDNRPAARYLYFHFVITLLRNKRDRQPGWEKYYTELRTVEIFATPGPYIRKSMLSALARNIGGLNTEEEMLIGEEQTFEEEDRLDEVEEQEIGRRVLMAYGNDDDEDGESSGSDEE
ncbi:hypothetical protein GJ744_012087 [Endocarpon pusillum]|uniref:HNH nuclease domain-containing protein n=1 Tax=Endocarpon pusillum TaxID=364733 RepID=A0A8H7ADW9_9EURO|nr:hypothetical protein GJ744_012087 [Endocarpon pusillum]